MKRILSTLTGLLITTFCMAGTIDNSTVKQLDLNRFLGSWYEIARYDHWFEGGMERTKATYKLREDGKIEVLNTGIKNGKPKESKGKAKLTDTPALLRVSFFGPFYSDYRVMLIDKDYQYALIGSGSDSYLWILSRTPKLTENVKSLILKEVKRREPPKKTWNHD